MFSNQEHLAKEHQWVESWEEGASLRSIPRSKERFERGIMSANPHSMQTRVEL